MKRIISCAAAIAAAAAIIGLLWYFLADHTPKAAKTYMKEHPYTFDTHRDLGEEQQESYLYNGGCVFLAWPKIKNQETDQAVSQFVQTAKDTFDTFIAEEGTGIPRLTVDYQAVQKENYGVLTLSYGIGRYEETGEGKDTLWAEKEYYLGENAELLGLDGVLGADSETKINLLLKSSDRTTDNLEGFTLRDDTLTLQWADAVEFLSVSAIARAGTIDPDKPMIALTFDDGPGKYSRQFADLLEQYNAHATFFVLGLNVANYSESLKYVYEKGNEIGSHTYSHKNLLKLSESGIRNEIQRSREAIKEAIGVYPTVLRTPYGNSNETVLKIADEPIIKWNVDTEDWRSRNAQAVKEEILKGAGDGNIILMHEIYESTYEGLALALRELTAQGYQMVTVSELMDYRGVSPENKVYHAFPPSNEG